MLLCNKYPTVCTIAIYHVSNVCLHMYIVLLVQQLISHISFSFPFVLFWVSSSFPLFYLSIGCISIVNIDYVNYIIDTDSNCYNFVGTFALHTCTRICVLATLRSRHSLYNHKKEGQSHLIICLVFASCMSCMLHMCAHMIHMCRSLV